MSRAKRNNDVTFFLLCVTLHHVLDLQDFVGSNDQLITVPSVILLTNKEGRGGGGGGNESCAQSQHGTN